MLSAHNLAKNFKGRNVVKDVSIEISQSQIVGLLGPNGAGKTTCFYMIVGLIQADSGRVLLDQKDMTKLPIHDRGRHGLSYLPQESSIFRNLGHIESMPKKSEFCVMPGKRSERTGIMECSPNGDLYFAHSKLCDFKYIPLDI